VGGSIGEEIMHLPRGEAQALLETFGAKAQSTVTKKTDVLIIGSEPGVTKLSKARSLSIPVIPWEVFVALGLTQHYPPPRTTLDPDLLSAILLQSAVVCNGILTLAVTNGDRRLFTLYRRGAKLIELFLVGAYGRGSDGPRKDVQDDEQHLPDSRRCFAAAAWGWNALADALERSSLDEDAGEG
jgi:hypothetical protein